MFSVTVTDKGGSATTHDFDQREVTVGRVQGNDIVLPKSNISKRHARIIDEGGGLVLIDSKSTNGTFVNGERIEAPYNLAQGDKVFIGEFVIEVHGRKSEAREEPPPAPPVAAQEPADLGGHDAVLDDDSWAAGSEIKKDWSEQWNEPEGHHAEGKRQPASARPTMKMGRAAEPVVLKPKKQEEGPGSKQEPARAAPRPAARAYAQALREVHARLFSARELKRPAPGEPIDEAARASIRDAASKIVTALKDAGKLPPDVEGPALIEDAVSEVLGLGPLADLLHDDSVSEIMLNGPGGIYVERRGRLEKIERAFSSGEALRNAIGRLLASAGRALGEDTPIVEARLDDGSRLHVVMPPLAPHGPIVRIHKPRHEPLQIDDLVASGTLSAAMATFLETCVKARKNILVSGAPGCGTTATLNVLAGFIPESERIITVEQTAELALEQEHVVSLESREAGSELLQNALCLRPDRVIVDECRGAEVFDLVQAMSAGYGGCLATVHATSPQQAVARLESMCLLSGVALPAGAVRDQIVGAIDTVVQQSLFADGARRVTSITHLAGCEGQTIVARDVFVFERQGAGGQSRVTGRHKATGYVPSFWESLKAAGLAVDPSIFQG